MEPVLPAVVSVGEVGVVAEVAAVGWVASPWVRVALVSAQVAGPESPTSGVLRVRASAVRSAGRQ